MIRSKSLPQAFSERCDDVEATEEDEASEESSDEEEEDIDQIIFMDQAKFFCILLSWFDKCNMDITDIMNVCYKYYYHHLHDILLVYTYYSEEDYEESGYGEPKSESILWIVHSNGNIYKMIEPKWGGMSRGNAIQKELSSLFVHKDNIYEEKKKPLSSQDIMKLITILVNLQIEIYQYDSESGGECYVGETNQSIYHWGRDIAEKHGLEIKVYKDRRQINNYPLNKFMRSIGIDHSIVSVNDVEDTEETWFGGYEFDIDIESNTVRLESDRQYS